MSGKPFPPGIHVPSLTFFRDDPRQEIDWDVQERHLDFLISSEVHGIVLAGTNGEAATLTTDEKVQLVRLTNDIVRRRSRERIPVVVGCGGGCTRAVLDETIAAARAGAHYALVLVPSYFHFAMDDDAIIAFFQEVAGSSPIPILIYNFPGVAAGLDVNSDMLDVLGQHPNILGVKLTCGGIAKVTRATARFAPEQFAVMAGQSDWLVPALSVGGTGCVTGVANLYPRTCCELYNLYSLGEVKEAERLQRELSVMEWGFAKGGISGTKWVVAQLRGYPESSAHCRRPYPKFADKSKQKWILDQVRILDDIERRLAEANSTTSRK